MTDKEIASARQEIKLMNMLDHPNVMKLESFEESPEKISLIMDKADGDMRDFLLDFQGPLNEKFARKVFK